VLLTRIGMPRLWREDPDVLWAILRGTVAPVTYGLTRAAVYGVERVPASGGAVIAANHLNAIDHPLVGLASPRPVYFISKAELLEIPVVGEVFTWCGTFAVRRGEPDREALRHARHLVSSGKVVGFHVEGTRQRTGHPGVARRGAALVAMSEGAVVVPCGLETYGWSFGHPRRCALVWGSPISLADLPRSRAGTSEATERIRVEIVRLWELAREAVATGFPDELSDGTARSQLPKPSLAEVRRTWAAAANRCEEAA
jgi:1-acyl-sn-glycerol-3-phosphate acyltransferase